VPTQLIKSNARANLIRRDVQLRQELTSTFNDIGIQMRDSHQDIVSDWDHKPEFKIGMSINPYLLSVQINVTGDNALIWQYVDKGTKPHSIYPKQPGGRLVFQTGYNPRTTPVAQAHVGDGRASGDWVTAKAVQHPGSDAREFTETLRKFWKPEFYRQVKYAFARALRR
jgi:hypothetical protein